MDPKRMYEIYKACRLCGTGGGYKMPIYQGYIDLDDEEFDLQRKIQECLQIQVYDGDKMPPLICELCVEKINEFYHFKQLCNKNDMKTRELLSLPLDKLSTEIPLPKPIKALEKPFIDSKKEKALAKKEASLLSKENQLKNRAKELKIKEDKCNEKVKELKSQITALTKQNEEHKILEEQYQEKQKELEQMRPEFKELLESKILLKKEQYSLKKKESYWKKKAETLQKSSEAEIVNLTKEITTLRSELEAMKLKRKSDSCEVERSSRSSSVTSNKPSKRSKRSATPNITTEDVTMSIDSKTKQALTPPKNTKVKTETPTDKKKMNPPKPVRTENDLSCPVCHIVWKTLKSKWNHVRSHNVTFTNPKLACNACKLWFESAEESSSHHRSHASNNQPYRCEHCCMDFNTDKDYNSHFTRLDCLPFYTVPDVQCLECWIYFPTETMKSHHLCLGEDGRPGGKCAKCNMDIVSWKELIIHEATCKPPPKVICPGLENVKADPNILATLLNMQVRVTKCDALLKEGSDTCNIGLVRKNYGLDKKSVYPYFVEIKQEPLLPANHMVSINQDIQDEFLKDYVHWDSDEFDSDEEENVSTLTSLCLKVMFSNKMLGKVIKKRRKVKTEKLFEANANDDFNDGMGSSINDIIESLGVDDDSDVRYFEGIDVDKDVSDVNRETEGMDVDKSGIDVNKDSKDMDVDGFDKVNDEDSDCKDRSTYDKTDGTLENNDNSRVDENSSNSELKEPISEAVDRTLDSENEAKNLNDIPQQETNSSKSIVEANENDKDFTELDSTLTNETVNKTFDNDVNCRKDEQNSNEKQLDDIITEDSSLGDSKSNTAFENRTLSPDNYTVDDIEKEKVSNEVSESNDSSINDVQNETNLTCAIKNEKSNKDTDAVVDPILNNSNFNIKFQSDSDAKNEIGTETLNAEHSSHSTTESLDKNCQNDSDNDINKVSNDAETTTPDQSSNNRTEIENLMKDLSDLSGTDDVQQNVTESVNVNVKADQATDDADHDRFMKELDEQIGDDEVERIEDRKDDSFDNLNRINKELDDRLEKALDSVSDEEFDFDA